MTARTSFPGTKTTRKLRMCCMTAPRDRQDLFRMLCRDLCIPDPAMNWDGLSDYLQDLSWLAEPDIVICIGDFGTLPDNDKTIFCEILRDTARWWQHTKGHRFSLYLPRDEQGTSIPNTVRICCVTGPKDRKDLFRMLYRDLSIPDPVVNWDGLSDYLQDLSWVAEPDIALCIGDFGTLSDNDKTIFCEILQDTARWWQHTAGHAVYLHLPQDTQADPFSQEDRENSTEI